MSLNSSTIMGRLAADAELRETQNGDSVCKFTVAVDRPPTKDGERVTDWVPVVAWGATAQFISKYFQKGSMIAISGSLQTYSYEDKEGNRRSGFNIKAERVSFCGGKEENSSKEKTAAEEKPVSEEQSSENNNDDDDQLPF